MGATLYSLKVSHPSKAALGMLRHKGIEPTVVQLPPGSHPVLLRGLGFRRGTVPALKLDGRRIQGSLQIARALEDSRPDPPLYPADPVGSGGGWRRPSAGASRSTSPSRGGCFAGRPPRASTRGAGSCGRPACPAPDVAGVAIWPMTLLFARLDGIGEKEARADFDAIPSCLDRVDALIADGTLDGDRLNAADFQIGTTTRVLLGFPELHRVIEQRPAGAHARRVLPDHPGPVPAAVPPAWLGA